MKLKIFNRFLIPALIVGAMGTFSSCKDTNEDYWNDIQNQLVQNTTVTDKLNQDVAALQSAIAILQAQNENLEAELAKLKAEAQNHVTYDEMNTAIAKAIAAVETKIDINTKHIEEINALLGDGVQGNYNTVAERLLAMEEELVRLSTIINDLKIDLDATYALAVKANEQSIQNLTYIQNLQEVLEQYMSDNDEAVANLNIDLANLSGDFEAYKTSTDQAIQDIWDAIGQLAGGGEIDLSSLQQQITEAVNDIDGLKARMDAAEINITKLQNDLQALTGWTIQISNRISSIFVEATDSPILGYLKTPINVQSNILFNWFGQSLQAAHFPALQPFGGSYHGMEPEIYNGDYYYVNPDINFAFLESVETIDADQYYMNSDNSLGSIYVNVNPVGISMDGKQFNIISSNGVYNAVAINEVKPYTGDLNFGFSRAEASGTSYNGLYEISTSVASLDEATIQKLNFDLESGIKSDLIDVLKQHNLSSLAGFANLVYEQFKADGSNAIPALAVNAAWSETDNTGATLNYSVNSNFGLAAATVRPLSFSTLDGADYSGHLRSLPSIDEFLNDLKFNIEGCFEIQLTPITINGITLTPITITIDPNEVIAKVEVPYNFTTDGAGNIHYDTKFEEIKASSLESLVNEINTQLSSFTGNTQTEINNMIANIQSQINQMLQDITDQIDSSVSSLQNEINGKIEKITNKIKNYYSKVEKVYDRIKSLLSNPNHYLQVTMLYDGANGIHRVSSSKAVPSYIEAGNITLIPTTYNAEILTPAYLKYVVVSNVMKSDDYSVNAANDNTCLALLNTANSSQYLNEVIPGERRTVAFDGSNLQAGYTYEILYQALDYRGSISTQKFYINIR